MPSSNKLNAESSPYLLQHANNPVNWQAWNEEALNEAKREDKPIILSIGYAACHWCHVMEHESFEDEQVAQIMNENYVCIKVDREERPDVDQVYMDAIQAMGLNGGWPLNVFLMPDQTPFYGGTYFPKNNWIELLDKVAVAYQTSKDKLAESAKNFANALNTKESDRLNFNLSNDFSFDKNVIEQAFQKLLKFVDWDNGGTLGAPKFPMPVIWEFLLSYYNITKSEKALEVLELTLTEMANGGIYDQIGGGFARYSVDAEWFAPHFEKMLYDNSQLISLYAKAALASGNLRFKEVVEESVNFVNRELKSEDNGFYSALDADSEGVEGKYYTWPHNEVKDALKKNSELISNFYSVKEDGNWEDGRNILVRQVATDDFARLQKIDVSDFQELLKNAKETLLKTREERIKPALDDKMLCGWNALQLNALCDAYKMNPTKDYSDQANASFEFITNKFMKNNQLFRNHKNGKSSITAYLEDYALIIQALIKYFEISSDEKALTKAEALCSYVIENFYDDSESLFYYTDKQGDSLIARKKELFDNVIPSSNAVMAENLHWLGILIQKSDWLALSDKMVHQLKDILPNEPKYLSKWLQVYSLKAYNSYEVVLTGKKAHQMQKELWQKAVANTLFLVNPERSKLEIFNHKPEISDKTTVYVCQKHACQQPVFTIDDTLAQINL